MRRGSRGMTLLEIIIVSVILGVLMVSSLPRFAQTAERLRVERSAAELALTLRYAHARAVAQGQAILWRWDAGGRCLRLSSVTLDGTETALDDRFSSTHAVDPAAEVSIENDGEPITEARFFPDGTAEAATVTLTHGQRAYTVKVDGPTAQVSNSTGNIAR